MLGRQEPKEGSQVLSKRAIAGSRDKEG